MEKNEIKKPAQIVAEIEKHQKAISSAASDKFLQTFEALREALHAGAPSNEIERLRQAREEAREEAHREEEKNTRQKIIIEILRDNLKQSIFKYNIHIICNIWNKYAGKPHGEKTADKIRAEIYTATGYRSHIYNKYGDYATICLYATKDHPAPVRALGEIEITSNEPRRAINESNKICPLDASAFRVYYCGAYVGEVAKHADKIGKLHAKARTAQKALESAISEYNGAARGKVERANTRDGVKFYII